MSDSDTVRTVPPPAAVNSDGGPRGPAGPRAPGAESALAQLAAGLDPGRYRARLVTPRGRLPYLHVASRDAGILAENVYAHAAWYWYGWGEKIAPVTDPPAAAARVAAVLAAHPGDGHG